MVICSSNLGSMFLGKDVSAASQTWKNIGSPMGDRSDFNRSHERWKVIPSRMDAKPCIFPGLEACWP